MVLFLARSAVCIGLVATAASGVGLVDLAATLGSGLRRAAEDAGQACLRSAACVRTGAEAAALAASPGDPTTRHAARPARPGPGG